MKPVIGLCFAEALIAAPGKLCVNMSYIRALVDEALEQMAFYL